MSVQIKLHGLVSCGHLGIMFALSEMKNLVYLSPSQTHAIT